jgi:lambda family phage minor tail protein L
MATTPAKVLAEQTRFDPTALLNLFELNGTSIGMSSVFYFCSATNANMQPVVFNGITYTPFPIEMTEMGQDGKGNLTRPKITASNINGFMSALLLQNDDLTGASLTRRRVFARFIDASNFPGSISPYSPDPTAAYPDEPWIVNRKISENQQYVQWELSSSLDLQNIKLPRRQIIANVCTSPVKYRDPRTCGYSGPPVADSANRTFLGYYGMSGTITDTGSYDSNYIYSMGDYVTVYSSLPQLSSIPIIYVRSALQSAAVAGINPVGNPSYWILDGCAKNCAACVLRFPGRSLRFGGFPGVSRASWT